MKKLLCAMCLLLLAGCGSGNKEALSCNGELAGMSFFSTLEKNGEFVSVEEIEMEFPYKELGLDGDMVEKRAKDNYDVLNDYDGVSASIDRTDEVISLTISVDYEKADLKKLAKNESFPIYTGDDNTDPSKVNFDMKKKSYEQSGLSCSMNN